MKRNILFILILLLAAVACNEKTQLSDAYGNFESREVTVSAEAQGRIMEFKIEEGMALTEGAYLGYIDTVALSLQRDQLNSKIVAVLSQIQNINSQKTVQQQQLDNLMIDKKRVEKLLKDGAATQKQYDDIVGAIRIIEKQMESLEVQKRVIMDEVETIKVQIELVEDNIGKCYIKNPVNGTVLTKFVEESEIATPGRPLYKIANLNQLELKVYISGVQLTQVKIGQKVEVLVDEDEKTNRSLEGVVSWISEQAEFTPKIVQTKEERVNLVYAMKVVVKNNGSLKIGMPGEVNFTNKEN